jgi:hypothetical protein
MGLVGFAGFVAAAAVVGACSGSSPPGDKYPAMGDFCKAKAQGECAQVAGFCEVDQTACVTARTQDCIDFGTKAQGKGRAYVPGNAPACVDLATSTYSTNSIKDPATTLATLEDTCNRVFSGSVPKNGACSSDYDCTGTLICDKKHCGEKTVVKNANDGCANAGEVCDVGLYCNQPGSGALPVCTPKMAVNQPCSDAAPCVESAYCVAGTCQPRQATASACTLPDAVIAACDDDPGTPCVTSDSCTSNFCDDYNPAGSRCGSILTFSVGEPRLCTLFTAPVTSVSAPPTPDAGPTPVGDAAAE